MRLTLRGKIVLAAVTVVLGLTAQHWNPYTEAITRQADQGVYEQTPTRPE